MDKQEIKTNLLEAIRHNEHLTDIERLSLFGSYVTGQPDEDSDVDVLVKFTDEAHIGFFEYARIQRMLGEALGAKVDLVTHQALSKYIRDQVLKEMETIYEKG